MKSTGVDENVEPSDEVFYNYGSIENAAASKKDLSILTDENGLVDSIHQTLVS